MTYIKLRLQAIYFCKIGETRKRIEMAFFIATKMNCIQEIVWQRTQTDTC